MAFVIDLETDIAAPPAVVWEVITDLRRYGEWNPFVVACESTLRPGEAITMQVKLGRRPQKQVEWMTDYDEGRGFAYRMKPVPAGALSSERSHALEDLGGNRTRYRSHFALKGWLAPLVRGLLGGRLQAGFGGMTEGIRQRAEALWKERQAA